LPAVVSREAKTSFFLGRREYIREKSRKETLSSLISRMIGDTWSLKLPHLPKFHLFLPYLFRLALGGNSSLRPRPRHPYTLRLPSTEHWGHVCTNTPFLFWGLIWMCMYSSQPTCVEVNWSEIKLNSIPIYSNTYGSKSIHIRQSQSHERSCRVPEYHLGRSLSHVRIEYCTRSSRRVAHHFLLTPAPFGLGALCSIDSPLHQLLQREPIGTMPASPSFRCLQSPVERLGISSGWGHLSSHTCLLLDCKQARINIQALFISSLRIAHSCFNSTRSIVYIHFDLGALFSIFWAIFFLTNFLPTKTTWFLLAQSWIC
jgi:hypothetical protein